MKSIGLAKIIMVAKITGWRVGKRGGHLCASGKREEREGHQLSAGSKKSKLLNCNLLTYLTRVISRRKTGMAGSL